MSPQQSRGSECVTEGVRVHVSPWYMPEHSDTDAGQFVFGYRIRITNESDRRARLLSRYWRIVDADGETHEVRGEGVVGVNPDLGPGESFEYASYCPLETSWGTMEGSYHMQREDASVFDVRVERFYLVAASQTASSER